MRSASAFTLVELILVMAILATILALSAPSLSRSFKQRNVDQEATRLLALTEYARDEAVSQGVPMSVWIEPNSGRFGVAVKDGYAGDASREKTYELPQDVHFELSQAATGQNGHVDAAEFAPDGTLDTDSIEAVRIVDTSNSAVSLAQDDDGWGYEIVKP